MLAGWFAEKVQPVALEAFDQAVKIKPNARWRWVALREKAQAEIRKKELSQ